MTSFSHRLFEQPWPEGEYRLFQVGLVVDDLLVAAAQWAHVFAVGPFHVFPRIETPCTYRGTETAVDLQIAVAQAGPVQIELMTQYCDRPSVYRELVDRGASRFHQLSTITSDYQGKKAYFDGLGYELVSEMVVRGQHVGFVDTLDDFGFFTELVEDVPGFVAGLTGIARTCAEWDGTDPVRILTRDGYHTPEQ
jgi:Glyoxalase/Bleomycin resistance protein/Dioxygenase superfamily